MSFQMAVVFFLNLDENINILIIYRKNKYLQPILKRSVVDGGKFFSKNFFTEILLNLYIFIKTNTNATQ